MPLRKDYKRRSDTDSDSKTDISASDTITEDRRGNKGAEEEEIEEDEEETQDAWLESLGIENSEIQRINNSQVRMRLCCVFSYRLFFLFNVTFDENISLFLFS